MAIVRVDDLRTQVVNEILDRIRTGNVDPHVRFTENSVSAMLGVSRTPAREALALLAQRGILQQNKRGFTLPRPTLEQLAQLTAVRQQLEPFAMRLVVSNLDQKARLDLAATIRMEATLHADDDSYISAHARIRDTILDATGNEILNDTIRQFDNFVMLVRVSTLKQPNWRAQSVAGQLAKADLIERGDPAEVEAFQRQMIEVTRQAFEVFLGEAELIESEAAVEVSDKTA
ncbi:MAG: hypothetical protein CML66_13820 [Rhodobacteraceae bacterium]|nr:hypothetical protein [Paracoccaceae bacterium]MAY45178.1 hypothetical protein [Paracoccaceae bacterium]